MKNEEAGNSSKMVVFPIPLVTLKLMCDYVDSRQYGVNRTILLIMSPFIGHRIIGA
jgi:hypothetical protein